MFKVKPDDETDFFWKPPLNKILNAILLPIILGKAPTLPSFNSFNKPPDRELASECMINMTQARRSFSLLQHHDGTTSTAEVSDYGDTELQKVISQAASFLLTETIYKPNLQSSEQKFYRDFEMQNACYLPLITLHWLVYKAACCSGCYCCCALSAPVAEADADARLLLAKPYINSGSVSGPLTPLVGDLVATNRGYASLSLEGFSEDVNEVGFVDPMAHAAPVAYHAVAAPAVAAVKTVEVKAAAPAVAVAPVAYYHVAPAATVGYQAHHQVHHVPQVTVQKHTFTHCARAHITNWSPCKYMQSAKLREVFLMSSAGWPTSPASSPPPPLPPPAPPPSLPPSPLPPLPAPPCVEVPSSTRPRLTKNSTELHTTQK